MTRRSQARLSRDRTRVTTLRQYEAKQPRPSRDRTRVTTLRQYEAKKMAPFNTTVGPEGATTVQRQRVLEELRRLFPGIPDDALIDRVESMSDDERNKLGTIIAKTIAVADGVVKS